MKKTLALTTALALAIAAPAFANTKHMSVNEVFSKYDTDKDGALSKSEFDAKMVDKGKADQSDDKFAVIDKDGNGMISKTEMSAWDKKEKM